MAFTSEVVEINGQNLTDIGLYNVYIGNNEQTMPWLPSKNIVEDRTRLNDKSYFYSSIKQPLEFEMTFSLLDGTYEQNILLSLGRIFGADKPICLKTGDDITKNYYVVPISSVELITFGSKKGYFSIHFRSIFPYPLSNTTVIIQDYSTITTSATLEIFNPSNVPNPKYKGYFYEPEKIEFTVVSPNTGLKIINTSDQNRTFEFTGLESGETITVYNQKQHIVSSLGRLRLGNFNKQFFRLCEGNNVLKINQACVLTITCQYPLYC